MYCCVGAERGFDGHFDAMLALAAVHDVTVFELIVKVYKVVSQVCVIRERKTRKMKVGHSDTPTHNNNKEAISSSAGQSLVEAPRR